MPQSGSATLAAAPRIEEFKPSPLKSSTKQPFTITGTGFAKGARVYFKQEDAEPVDPKSITEQQITGVTPELTIGTVEVWVRNPGNQDSNHVKIKVVA
jgi:hypothetical protein